MQPPNPLYPSPTGAHPPGHAQAKVRVPSTIIIVTQALGIVIQLIMVIFRGAILGALTSFLQAQGRPAPADAMHGSPVLTILSLAGSVFIVFAMLQAQKLKRFPLVVVGTIMAMAPVVSTCCFLGLPFGIWMLIVLFDPEVRASFS